MTSMQIMLTINQQSKSIPYPAASHSDSQNYGFHVLKGKLDKCENVKEATETPSIISILKNLNSNESPFFSVGCERSYNQDNEGHWAKGYIEFAFNYEQLVTDAAQYFPLYFHFTKFIDEYLKVNEVQFWWDLQPAKFKKVSCMGYSSCIWITTGFHSSEEEAKQVWEKSINMLDEYLSKHGNPKDLMPIYGSKT